MDALPNDPRPTQGQATGVLSPADPAVLADDALIEAVRAGRRGTADPDPLVRLLACWRELVRRPRRGRRAPRTPHR
ncbi:hypothetical protein GCM10009836_40110 [Pseudonocardia ailaonensis]|uniref:Uncharacterized protein n=1 Tax=Pseudonocardia ailaonensis TaxID=367279 RepID=A0ABN2N760_9PSEU